MAADFENIGYKAVPKTVPWKKMAADFENMGYEAVQKTVPRIKMAARFAWKVPEAL